MRLSIALAFAFAIGLGAPAAHAAISNGYTCTDNGSGAKCTCEGVSDCAIMKGDGVCKLDTRVCDANGCHCEWKQKVVAGKPLHTVKPISNMPVQVQPAVKP